jgi:hypothetical protein
MKTISPITAKSRLERKSGLPLYSRIAATALEGRARRGTKLWSEAAM